MSSALKSLDEDNREWLISSVGFVRHYQKYCDITFLKYFHSYPTEGRCSRCGKSFPEIVKTIIKFL